ncbi:hypothetical protein AC579_9718 [Pseudocercospora musae]|uniref:Uncharacterized protein n=1 Tax=Pseudocercospora musae TaxID=113226 RepID=A0A139HZF1_9PEZI|nr:hypothetical protein AC579_9718 [Pseudocercospora musae]
MKTRNRRSWDDEHTFVDEQKHTGLADIPSTPQWTARRRSVENACRISKTNHSITLTKSEYISRLHLHHDRKHRPASLSTKSANKTQPPLTSNPQFKTTANMKLSAFVIGLIGLTTVHGLATPNAAAGLQVRQNGLITQLNEAIDALQIQLTAAAGNVNEVLQLQEAIASLQAVLDFLTT